MDAAAEAEGTMRKDKSYQTPNCLICLRPATTWTGHVLHGEDVITAGWCVEHVPEGRAMRDFAGRQGCFGGYLPAYDIEEAR